MYRTIYADKIIPTVKTLCQRIEERVPGRSISMVCKDLYAATQEVQQQEAWIKKPNIYLRIGIAVLVSLVIIFISNGLANMNIADQDLSLMDIISLMESAINDLVFIGAGIYFLVSIENRIKRKRTLDRLNELRALAHVIDMHQLTKELE